MKLLDPSHPFFRPLWRRAAVTAAPFLWAFVELSQDNAIWAYLFAGIGGFLAWHLLITWRDPGEED
ncbi:hypothetical protein V8J82_02430 [Gymnodinialimonas sp. 2305UL16-5]|uniref:hypothetical protein n=1 Tax=Gymnodinialimonas mytili TaxID=3126503 RepID=UPI00309A7790